MNCLIFSSILLNAIQCVVIPDQICEQNYFDSIVWTSFDYKLTRNTANGSYIEWTLKYNEKTKSFTGFVSAIGENLKIFLSHRR